MNPRKDGLVAEVTGTVAKIFPIKDEKMAFEMEYMTKGAEYPSRIAVFGLEEPEIGARMTVRGALTVRKNEYMGKIYVNVSIWASEILDPGEKHGAWDGKGWHGDDVDPNEPF